ncbi:MAG: hypothetical protein ABW186_14705, partial [Rhodanobacteraceae bacterium]
MHEFRTSNPSRGLFAATLIALSAAAHAQDATDAHAATATVVSTAPAQSSSSDCSSSFASRLAAAYREDFNPAPADPSAAQASPPARRAPDSPFPSPPFPSAEWQLGGVAYPIGVPNLNSRYPLERALECTGFGKWMTDNRIEIYGWINPSANLSTSNFSNYPLS